MKINHVLFFIVLNAFSSIAYSQVPIDTLPYESNFRFNNGIYYSYSAFKTNNPNWKKSFDFKGSVLYFWNDSLKEMSAVDPEKVWGFAKDGNIYISHEGGFWKIINLGRLSQFTAIVVTSFVTMDTFGFPVERYSKSLEQLFFDFDTGVIQFLVAKNIEPYLESEPLLALRYEKLNKKKSHELIIVLKAFNELNPIYFPIYE